jgi:topoisomerase IA-like protein
MKALSNWKFRPPVKSSRAVSSPTDRQQKLVDGIEQQIQLVTAALAGKTLTDADGKKIKPWYMALLSGKYEVCIRYGTHPLEFPDGTSVECDNLANVLAFLTAAKTDAANGELNNELTALAKKLRTAIEEGRKKKAAAKAAEQQTKEAA